MFAHSETSYECSLTDKMYARFEGHDVAAVLIHGQYQPAFSYARQQKANIVDMWEQWSSDVMIAHRPFERNGRPVEVRILVEENYCGSKSKPRFEIKNRDVFT
jgi:hypothetical protein